MTKTVTFPLSKDQFENLPAKDKLAYANLKDRLDRAEMGTPQRKTAYDELSAFAVQAVERAARQKVLDDEMARKAETALQERRQGGLVYRTQR